MKILTDHHAGLTGAVVLAILLGLALSMSARASPGASGLSGEGALLASGPASGAPWQQSGDEGETDGADDSGEGDVEAEESENMPPEGRVYRRTDEQGNIIFSDRPPQDGEEAEEVDVRDPNFMPGGTPDLPRRSPDEAEEETFRYQELAIVSPEHEETFHNPETVSVRPRVDPGLRPGHSLELFNNGEQQEGMVLDWPYRGSHELELRVLDEHGEVVQRSEPVTIFVHRASRLQNN